MKKKPIIIAGPCAAENEEQILASLEDARKRGIDFLRISLWKPRTKPGFDGIGDKGIDLLVKVAKMGVNPSTEVILPQHAQAVIDAVLPATKDGKLLIWIGARNQNHYIQQEIARVAAAHDRVYLMVKNQPWHNYEHWEGIIEHVLAGGMPKERLLICHRGFIPNGVNPHGYRNVPDYDMTEKIRVKYGLPMIFDPSHTGGTVDNVFLIAQQAAEHPFDGLIVEVHPDPKNAMTDAKQQLTWEQFDTLAKPQGTSVLF